MLLLQRGSMMTGTSAHATKLSAFSSLSLSLEIFSSPFLLHGCCCPSLFPANALPAAGDGSDLRKKERMCAWVRMETWLELTASHSSRMRGI